MKVLVTGAAGFIGSHLARRLLTLGHEVRVVDNLSTGRRENLATVLGHVEFLEEDLADPAVCSRAVRDVEMVFHEAAIASVTLSLAEPERAHRTNIDATFNILEASRRESVRRVIYAGSSAVYGDSEEQPIREGMPVRPRSFYAMHKHVGELYGRVYGDFFGLEVSALRYFNVFGPGQDPHSEYSAVIPKFIANMKKGQRPTIFGDGLTSRDFVFVDDVVDANILAMTAPKAAGKCLNIGSGESVTLIELVETLNRLLAVKLSPLYSPERSGDIRHSRADIRLAAEVLGYRPRVPFEEGLQRTIEAFEGER